MLCPTVKWIHSSLWPPSSSPPGPYCASFFTGTLRHQGFCSCWFLTDTLSFHPSCPIPSGHHWVSMSEGKQYDPNMEVWSDALYRLPQHLQSSFSAFTEVTHYTRMLLLVKSVDCQDYRHQTGRGSMCSAYHGVSNSQRTAKHIGSLSIFTKDGTSKTLDIPGSFLSIIKKFMSRWQSACLVVQHLQGKGRTTFEGSSFCVCQDRVSLVALEFVLGVPGQF